MGNLELDYIAESGDSEGYEKVEFELETVEKGGLAS